ncbi:type III secretion system protein [Leclercia adecarboxylata]|nr:type III secretion system protein [Leclercia adecarboxylata]KMN64128.1 type III secretion system protein [Leclercia sp. LK8]
MQTKTLFLATALLTGVSPLSVAAQSTDCITEAAQCFKINPLLIKAIIWHESKNQQKVINYNNNKTVDVGVMQINTVHFSMLKSRGIDEQLLRQNSCANVYSGAWILKQSINRYGYTWDSVGSYHSRTSLYHDRYVEKIVSLIAHQTAIINRIHVTATEGIREKFSCE